METIDAEYEKYKDYTPWELVDYCHTLGEWEDPHGSSIPLSVISEKMEWSFRNSGMLFRNKRNEESFWSKARPFKSYSEASFC